MKNMTVGRRIYALVGLLALVIAGLSTFAVLRIRLLNTISQSISGDSMPGIINMGVVKSGQAENQIRVQRLVRAETADQRKALRAEMTQTSAENTEALKKYEATIFDDEDRRLFAELNTARAEFQKGREKFFSL